MWHFCILYVFGLQIYRVWVGLRLKHRMCKKAMLDKNATLLYEALLHFHYLTWQSNSKPLEPYHSQLSTQMVCSTPSAGKDHF